MSIPCLHSPVVATSVPSTSMVASSKNVFGCCRQTFSRARRWLPARRKMSPASKRRQKSPAVVGSGIRSAPRASRKTSSLRRSSMSSRRTPVAQRVVGQVQARDPIRDRADGSSTGGDARSMASTSPTSRASRCTSPMPPTPMARACRPFPTGCSTRATSAVTPILPRSVQPPLDPPLGLPQTFRYTGFHSKSSLRLGLGFVHTH